MRCRVPGISSFKCVKWCPTNLHFRSALSIRDNSGLLPLLELVDRIAFVP